ncbi:MAG: class I SAM-dependent methyltransferase [Acidobacteriota bacterium]|nr:class I SAM-dependent methyltransferase [Acidobacteriota bacterium]
MAALTLRPNLAELIDHAWQAARDLPGFLLENEARFLAMAAACAPEDGVIVEIGSFKGKSTVVLGTVAKHYGLGPVVAIDPHTFHSAELEEYRSKPGASSYDEFMRSIESANLENIVEVHRDFSNAVCAHWQRPIRFLWIDGDHSYAGAKADFDGFMPHVVEHGIVAFHDALHEFAGPIRVFVEDVLRSNDYGAAGFVNSIAWSQYRPADGEQFHAQRAQLAKRAELLIPFLNDETGLKGARKALYKLRRSQVPRSLPTLQEFASALG